MKILKAKITRIELDEPGTILVTIHLEDGQGLSVEKTFSYYTVEDIKFDDFKKRVTEEIEQTFKGLEKTKELKVGMEFGIEINEH